MRRLRVNVFDCDPYSLKLFEALLSARGYEVQAFDEAVSCPIYSGQRNTCLAVRPCADIVLAENQMPVMTGIELLLLQSSSGCKTDNRNKALLAPVLDHKERQALEGLGCAFIAKPFRVRTLYSWLDECEKRVDLSQPLGVMRKERRVPASIDVSFRSGLGEDVHEGTVVNVSGRGLCLQAAAPLLPQQSVVFASALPNRCTSASVRWVEGTDAGYHLAGLLAT